MAYSDSDLLHALYLADVHWQQIVHHVLSDVTVEACGLLGGVGRQVLRVFPVPNVASDPTKAYLVEPHEQIRVFLTLEELNMDLVGIYHSHPPGSRTDPSPTDLVQWYYSDAVYVIVVPSVENKIVSLRAFVRGEEGLAEVAVIVSPDASESRNVAQSQGL